MYIAIFDPKIFDPKIFDTGEEERPTGGTGAEFWGRRTSEQFESRLYSVSKSLKLIGVVCREFESDLSFHGGVNNPVDEAIRLYGEIDNFESNQYTLCGDISKKLSANTSIQGVVNRNEFYSKLLIGEVNIPVEADMRLRGKVLNFKRILSVVDL